MDHYPEREGRFHIEINGIAEFALFCALLRNDLEDGKVEALIEKLHHATRNLAAAEAADTSNT